MAKKKAEATSEGMAQAQATQPSFMRRKFPLLLDLWGFLKVRKKWWLLPAILMLLFVGVLIVLSQSSVLSPFVYALF